MAGPLNALSVEKALSSELQDNIRQTLAPIVGARNLNVSVALRINTDKKQVSETIYNPDSRVERSTRVIKENQAAQNSNGQASTSVERNIPNDKGKGDGKVSNEENHKKEELTNYEISSKSVQTSGAGYAIERLSVAVLVNKSAILANLGEKSGVSLEQRLSELSELAATAAGITKERGDNLKLAAIEFSNVDADMAPIGESGMLLIVARQLGSIFSAVAVVIVALVAGGVAVRFLRQSAEPGADAELLIADENIRELPASTPDNGELSNGHSEVGESQRRRVQRRLESLIEADGEQAAQVIKGWLHEDARVEA